MNEPNLLSSVGKLTVGSLVVAAVGVVIQIVSGFDYPTIPPVFFILLIPAGLIAFTRWRWTPVLAVLGGGFLTFGLFASGESHRLVNTGHMGDAIGLWIQTIAVIIATVAAIITTIQNYRRQKPVAVGSP